MNDGMLTWVWRGGGDDSYQRMLLVSWLSRAAGKQPCGCEIYASNKAENTYTVMSVSLYPCPVHSNVPRGT